jgi:predicted HTH domain antitoxin
MSLVISDEILKASEMSEIVGMNQIKFQTLLANRGICIHYDVAEFQEDIKGLRERGWL